MVKKKGKSLKKNRAKIDNEPTDIVTAPHSFVLHRGLPCPYITDLTKDYRRMMEPFTASSLRERKNNKIKDFVNISAVFHVSHMCIFNKTKNQLSYKIARLPRGPTLSFKVYQFTLAKDIIASTRKQYVDEESFRTAPLVILNNFTGEGKHLKLMSTTFQNMYPTINLATVQLSTIKRCVLISYNPVTDLIDIRHYTVTVEPIGLSRGVKKVVLGKIPNMAKFDDIADFLTGETVSDTEYEDDEANDVILPQTLKSRGNIEDNKSAVKLYEIGPRLTVELMKIEDGLFNGEILYHKTVVKTEEELIAIKNEREQKKKLKESRKKLQAQNALNKTLTKDTQQKLPKINKNGIEKTVDEQPDDDDAAYYKEELGEEPDEDLFSMNQNSRKRGYLPKYMQVKLAKKRKLDNEKKSFKKGGDRDKKSDKKFGTNKKFGSDKKFKSNQYGSNKSSKFKGKKK